jgi:nitrile hydratase subunit beta
MSYESHADLGGQSGHGRVLPEREGELFHAAWEPKALALTLAAGATGSWNIDMGRSARETLPDYAKLSYYALWIKGLEKLLALRGLADAEEIAAGRMLKSPKPVTRVLAAADVPRVLAAGSPTVRAAMSPARFSVGDPVRTLSGDVPHHTRLPRYARGKIGRIDRVHGAHVFADTNAQGLGEQPRWLYTVVFDAAELWGAQATAGSSVSIDAWEPYLEAVATSSPSLRDTSQER